MSPDLRISGFVLLIAACGAATPAPASRPPPPCSDRLVPYSDWPQLEAAGPVDWSLDLAAGKGHVVFLGVHHSDDPTDPQFADLTRAWTAAAPTIAFFEGPDRPIADTAEATIAATGESGYVRFLARRDGIPAQRLDPDPLAEAAHLLARHPRDQVFLFYVLREVVRLRDRKDVPVEALPGAVEALLAQARARGVTSVFQTTAELEAAYRVHLGEPAAWWDAPSWWFSPLPRDRDELFTHRINRDSSEFRNRHMLDVIAAAAGAGQRVFAAVGANHVPMIAPALRCELGLANSHEGG